MKTILRASILLLGLLALPLAAHAYDYTKVTASGSLYPESQPSGKSSAKPKVKVPLTNQRIMALCGVDLATFSQNEIVFGISDTPAYGLFVVKKSDKSLVATFLTLKSAVLDDGSTGYNSTSAKGLMIVPVLSILGNSHAVGLLSGKSVGPASIRFIAAVNDNGNPRFALDGHLTFGAHFGNSQ